MQTFNARVSGTLEATALVALFTFISGSVQANLLTEYDFEGMGTSSAANELGIYRVGTAGVTGSGALTVTPTNPAYTAWAGTAFGGYSTQPIKGAIIMNVPINANGQRVFWRANPNLNNAISIPAGNVAAASIAGYTISGTAVVTGRIQLAAI